MIMRIAEHMIARMLQKALRSWPTGQKKLIEENTQSIDDVMGQSAAKLAGMIAIAGQHNLLMVGPPGEGKSTLCHALTSLAPNPIPFVSVGATTTPVSLVGGGRSVAHGGQLAEAHNGILYMDEVIQFPKPLLELLRGPIEDRQLSVSRNGITSTFPCSCMLLASTNPCPCGYAIFLPDQCSCTRDQIERYQSRLSGPIRDRIDIWADLRSLGEEKFEGQQTERLASKFQAAVSRAWMIQRDRGRMNSIIPSQLILTGEGFHAEAWTIFQSTCKPISTRRTIRIGRIARTIADTAGCVSIRAEHVRLAITLSTPIF